MFTSCFSTSVSSPDRKEVKIILLVSFLPSPLSFKDCIIRERDLPDNRGVPNRCLSLGWLLLLLPEITI